MKKATREPTIDNPHRTHWHEHTYTPEVEELRVKYSLSNRAASLIDGLCVASNLAFLGRAYGNMEAIKAKHDEQEAMALYLSELESERADGRGE